jgi:hypothetical protein
MSRDQRPRREVMVDSSPDPSEIARDTAIVDAAPPAPAQNTRLLLWSIVFLFACAAGALAVALLLPGMIR